MTRRSLVTGGAGFVGRHLVAALLARGEQVRVLDIADVARSGPDALPAEAEYRRGSILDADSVRGALAGCSRLYHLAANPNLWAPRASDFERTNLEGTRVVLAAAERAGLERIVYTSTESILKKSSRSGILRLPSGVVDETARIALEDMPGPYCRSKFLAEREALAAAGRGLPVVVVNPTMPIGPGDVNLTPPSRMILGFLNGETPAYLDCVFNLVDARDVAEGHILAAERGRVGERYILGNENIKLSDLLGVLHELTGLSMPRARVPYHLALAVAAVSEAVARMTGKPPVAPLTGVRLAGSPMAFDSAKAIAALGLPQTPLRRSLADAIAWFAARGRLRRAPLRQPLAQAA